MTNSRPEYEFDRKIRSGAPIKILGLNSGTSADGLNMVLAEFDRGALPFVIRSGVVSFDKRLRNKIIACSEPGFSDGIEWLKLDLELGKLFGGMAADFIGSARKSGLDVDLVASHGQTVRHLPEISISFQLGDPAVIASLTGLPVVADFRRSDRAAGGQGAPLSPILHEFLFRDDKSFRTIVNIGGISNVTALPPRKSRKNPFAADCGPGNMLIDAAMSLLYGKAFDRDGGIARSGRPSPRVISRVLSHRFFKIPPPKSTGRELFGTVFLGSILKTSSCLSPADIIATVSEITVRSISDFIRTFAGSARETLLCGGGAKNRYIIERLREELPFCSIDTTSDRGYDPDHIEPLLWAYLAYMFITGSRVSVRGFTGAAKSYIPGALWLP